MIQNVHFYDRLLVKRYKREKTLLIHMDNKT